MVEKIQPKALKTKRQLRVYRLTSGFSFGLFVWILHYLISSSIGTPRIGVFYSSMVSVSMGAACGLGINRVFRNIFSRNMETDFWSAEEITLMETLNFSISKIFEPRSLYLLTVSMLAGLTGGVSIGMVAGVVTHDIRATYISISLGFYAGLILGMLSILNGEIYNRSTPNQGMLNTASNFIGLTLISFPFSLLVVRVITSFVGNTFQTQKFLLIGLLVSIVVVGSISGGMACIQYISLRVVLALSSYTPWNYARFLNHCTERLLLQRVGGRYRFIHKLVQEHFAAME